MAAMDRSTRDYLQLRHESVEAEDVFMHPNRHSRDTDSAIFGRIQPYSLSSSPLYSRGALNTLHNAVFPP